MILKTLSLADANAFVDRLHRHHGPARGHKFSISAWQGGVLVGVAIIGRPVSRYSDNGSTVEVARLCTDGTKNACSFLYGAAAHAARALGYAKIQTYVLKSEPATSLKASGWVFETETAGVAWRSTDVCIRKNDPPLEPKQRWSKTL